MKSYKEHFARFLGTSRDRLHFAAHSHHLWPDVSREAHLEAWDLAAELVDGKWEVILGEIAPAVRTAIAGVLGLSRPGRLAFAPNTHELLVRLMSSFSTERPVRVLTTDSEFHSFRRQCQRWSEAGRIELETIATEPFETFDERFLEKASREGWDLVFVSHVFYDSGFVFGGLEELCRTVPDPTTVVVIDGYHGFLAIPTDLSGIEDRAFYVAGGYKYAMSGEGICFIHCPDGYAERPLDTGWFASFDELEAPEVHGRVRYGQGGQRFAGATFDPSGLFRMRSVLDLFARLGLRTEDVHARVRSLQALFLEELPRTGIRAVGIDQLIPSAEHEERGHFLTFRCPIAGQLHDRLKELDVVTDHRGHSWRLGFGLYHDPEDVLELLRRMRAALG